MTLPIDSTPFAAILNAIVVRMSVALNLSQIFIRPVLSDKYAVTETEELFCYVQCFKPEPCNATDGSPFPNIGAGRLARNVSRRVRVYLYTRSGVDVASGDEVALFGPVTNPDDITPLYASSQTVETPPTLPGHLIAEELVVNALDDWMPVDPTNARRGLTVGPIHWMDDNGPPERKPEEDAGLIRSVFDFQAVYTIAITQKDPAPLVLPIPIIPANVT